MDSAGSIVLTAKDIQRFRAKLERDPETGCLLFMGYRDRRNYAAGELQRELALAFLVKQQAISKIVNGLRWRADHDGEPTDRDKVHHAAPLALP